MFKVHLCCATRLYLYSLISSPSPLPGATDTLGKEGNLSTAEVKHGWMCTHSATHTSATSSPKLMDFYIKTTFAPWWLRPMKGQGHTLQVRKAWLCTRWSWQPRRDLLCHSNVLLPDSWPVWTQGWFASGHALSGDKYAALLAGSGCLEAQDPGQGGCPKGGTCWGSEFNQQPPNHGLNPQLLEEERWVLPRCWYPYDSPSCWRGIHIIVGSR